MMSEGPAAIKATFVWYKSLKRIVIVDKDIDIYSLDSVEWAIIIRMQADKRIPLKSMQKSSSLDPLADPHSYSSDFLIPLTQENFDLLA